MDSNDDPMIGRNFGKLVVRAYLHRNKAGHWYECLCECGKTRPAVSYKLREGLTTSCGCQSRTGFIDETGNRYGHLSVKCRVPKNGEKAAFECLCDCGNTVVVTGSHLRSGNTSSCGCKTLELAKANKNCGTSREKARGKALKSMLPEYKCWASMKSRCSHRRHKSYVDYGGSGVTVCDEWIASFDKFYEDMGPRPSPTHSIDRIDNSLGYTKENCRWATKAEQVENRRCAVLVESNGRTVNLSVAAREAGIPYGFASVRVRKGMSIPQIVTAFQQKYPGKS